MRPPPATWHVIDLAEVDYRKALDLQHRIVGARINGMIPSDVILMLEHPPVFTLGRRGGQDNLTVSESALNDLGIEVIQTERGGDITYHGPGQLVVYPIVDLGAARIKVVDFVQSLEEIMIRAARRFRVSATRETKNRGIWVNSQKLGSVGICVRHGVSFHGLALNVNLSLVPFGYIHPCGLEGVCMTSLSRELDRDVSTDMVRPALIKELESVFDVKTDPLDIDALRQMVT